MKKLFYLLILSIFLGGCDFPEAFTAAKVDIDEASEIIKSELNVQPSLTWGYESDFVRVTAAYNASELEGIDAHYLAVVTADAVKASFENVPDEIKIEVVLDNET